MHQSDRSKPRYVAHRITGGYSIRTAGARLGCIPGWSQVVFPSYNSCLIAICAVVDGVPTYDAWVEQGGGIKGARC